MTGAQAEATRTKRQESSGHRLDGLLCGLLVGIALVITHPAAEMAFLDEWSYVRSAMVLADTGRVTYYGASAMVGWQIGWGALFFKLFGWSFHLARSSMLPFALGAVVLMHACLRRFGVGRVAAALGSLTLGVSPLFFPLASSFMTDTGALFGVLLCVWMCLCAIDAPSVRHSVLWLAGATVLNLPLGTDRQIVWLGALVMVPATAWMLRARRGVLPVTAVLWLGSLVAVLTAVRWFSRQPGVQPAKLTGTVHPGALGGMLFQFLVRAPLCLALLVLPAAMFGLARAGVLKRAARLRLAAVTLLVALGYGALASRGLPEQSIMPWLLPITGNLGIIASNDELPGVRAVTLGHAPRVVLSLVVAAALWSLLEHAWARLRSGREQPKPARPVVSAADGWRPVVFTLGAFSTVYLLLLIPTELFGTGFFDRYLLFLIPLALVSVLKLFERTGADGVPALAWGTLAVTGLYVVMATHDWYASLRGRVALVDRLRAQGVPRTSLVAGWEYDAWTQMEAQGFINYKDMVRPAGQGYTVPPERKRPCERGIVDWTPAIVPKWVITYSPVPCFAPSEFAPVTYRTWLPPFDRKLMVMRVPGDE